MLKSHRTLRAIFIVLLVVLPWLFAFIVQSRLRELSPLHVEGRFIKNTGGQIIHFVGTTESQTSWRYDTDPWWRHELDPIPMAQRMSELGVTWVRICVTYSFWSDAAIGPSYRDLIDRYVDEFTNRKIYCTVGCMGHEFSDDLAEGNPDRWIAWLCELANRYKNNSGMCGIYLFNEVPLGSIKLQNWHIYAAEAAQVLNHTNPRLLIIVQADLPGKEGIDPYWITKPIPLPNVVYAFHEYYWQSYYYFHQDFAMSYASGNYSLAKQQLEQYFYSRYFKYAVEYNLPIILEEFGFNGNQNASDKGPGNEPGWPQCQIDWMDLLEKYQIPWNQYDWWVKTDTNYGLANEQDFYTLSPVGQIWSRYLRS